MRRIIGGIAVVLLCCVIFGNTISVDAVVKSKRITVEYVDDIISAESTKPCRYTHDELGLGKAELDRLQEQVEKEWNGIYHDYSDMSQYISCHFVLKEPSYVRIRRTQRLFYMYYNYRDEEYNNFHSDVAWNYVLLDDFGIVRTDSEIKMINGYQINWRRENNYCEVDDTYMVLDAGEYDIYPFVQARTRSSGTDCIVQMWEDGFLDVSVTAQPLMDKNSFKGLGFNDGYTVETEKAKENARTLVPGKKMMGFCISPEKLNRNDTSGTSHVVSEQYFKLNVDRNSKISLLLNRVGGKPNLKRGVIYASIMDMNGNMIQHQSISDEECELGITCDLEKGNYFVKVYSLKNSATQEYYLMYSDGSEASKPTKPTNPTDPTNPVTLSTPKLLTYKAGTKLIKGTSVPGTEVCVTVEGKKYVVDAKGKTFKLLLKKPLKKGKIIKVYAKVGKIQSKTKTYRVK